MPFTFSHPALILPLQRFKFLSMTGLIVGSLSPDFEYFFIEMKMKGHYSHTIEGAFSMDLPMAIIFAILFHTFAKRPLLSNLPVYFQKRLQAFYELDFIEYLKKNWLMFLVSTIIGVYSHILWDDFTHINGYFVRNMDFFLTEVSCCNLTLPVFKILQHSSTIIGGLIVLLYFHYSSTSHCIIPKSKFSYWFILILIASLIAITRLYFLEEIGLGSLVVVLIAAGLWSLVITGALTQLKKVSLEA